MKRLCFLAAFFAASFCAVAQGENHRVVSPDGQTYLDVHLTDGRLTYSAGYKLNGNDVPMLSDSPLGVMTNEGDFSRDLQLIEKHETAGVRHTYSLRQAKLGQVDKTENGLSLVLTTPQAKKKGILMAVQFSVFDNNIAYRYRFIQTGETACLVVNNEASGFRLPTDATAFICPQSPAVFAWKRTKPSYEEYYIWDEPVTTKSKYGQGWTFPCLFHEGDKGWVLISETGLTGNYCASHLSDATPDGLFTIAFPMPGENNGFGSTGAQLALGNNKTNVNDDQIGYTPWRTITLGRTLKPIVETTIPWDVVNPLYEPSKQYQGTRNTWSWILWQDASINYDDQVTFIDLAAKLGWEGCLIDGGWYENIGRERMEQLFAYCKEKGVNPWVWYNSNGGWNDAPQCARQAMSNPIARKHELAWLKQHGVAGIKVDFFGGDKQETIRLYEAILSDANDYGIQVIFHGCTLPRGWERMYPNYCGSEAVLASENLYFEQGFCDFEARHACLHPFVRNSVGAMEYGGTVLQKRLHREPGKGNTRRTSDVFELATAIAFQCSGQNFALTPRNLVEQPQFEIDFMRNVPTTWDETRFIDGYPGKYIVMARRHANRWYVIAMNAEAQPRQLTIDLSSFSAQFATLLHDGTDGKTPQQSTLKTDRKGRVKLTLQPQCAAIIL